MEEKERAERLAQETQQAELEVQRQRLRAEAAERERDLHAEVAKRHEDSLKKRREEVNEQLQQLEKQQQEMSSLVGDVKQQSEVWGRAPSNCFGQTLQQQRARANESGAFAQ